MSDFFRCVQAIFTCILGIVAGSTFRATVFCHHVVPWLGRGMSSQLSDHSSQSPTVHLTRTPAAQSTPSTTSSGLSAPHSLSTLSGVPPRPPSDTMSQGPLPLPLIPQHSIQRSLNNVERPYIPQHSPLGSLDNADHPHSPPRVAGDDDWTTTDGPALEPSKDELGAITVIITQYKRSTLTVLLETIRAQTYPIAQIIVYQNLNLLNVSAILAAGPYENITFVHNVNINTGFFGRFTLPLLLRTEYVAIFDDDNIPSKGWLQNCVRIVRDANAICGANGRIIHFPRAKMWSVRIPHSHDVEVDFVGHCWVFKRRWARHMFRNPPYTLKTAEDIHFSASCWIYGQVRTVVPKMPKGAKGRMLWPSRGPEMDPDFDTDEHAAWRFYQKHQKGLRTRVMKHWIKMGWKMLYMRGKGYVGRISFSPDVSGHSVPTTY
mmetsp:Transcript_34775/g.62167  ORF Transcript_34775/g.62167 Transcript_34775/m.62167 type:complete len:433 (-) Transcript_34775:475-1773(-)